MSLDNLNQRDKERFKAGDISLIKELIGKELDESKENLIFRPLEQVQELRGKAKILATILNLLG